MANVLDVVAGGISGLAKDAAAGIFSGIADIIARFKADPNIALQHADKLAELEAATAKAQLDAQVALIQAQTKTNEIEAGSADNFTRRWRPFIGWICGTGMALALIGGPFFTWGSAWIATGKPGPFPVLNTDLLITTLGGMLGLGGLRTFEKVQGVTK